MCSISGICNFEKKPSTQVVELMTKSLSHRGPDDSGFFNNENISFGHNRLSIIDLQKSKQPMQDQQNKNIIIFCLYEIQCVQESYIVLFYLKNKILVNNNHNFC